MGPRERCPRPPRPRALRAGRVCGADPGSALSDHGVLEERRALRDGRELLGELAVGQVQRARADEAERGGVPERRRAAVAERDLVAVGQREQLAQPVADAARRAPSRASGGARCPSAPRPRRRGARAPRGRTFDGPQPKRPSEGFRSSGIDQLLLGEGARRHVGLLAGETSDWSLLCGVPRRAAVLPRRFPVVSSTRAPVAARNASVANRPCARCMVLGRRHTTGRGAR